MKRVLATLFMLLLMCACAHAQTVTVTTPEDVVYVFMRAYVSVDGSGVCDSDEPWRVQTRLNRAPDDVWALASRLDTLRPRMMNVLTPVIQDCLRSPFVTITHGKTARNERLAYCVAANEWVVEFLRVGGVLEDIEHLLNPTRAQVHTGLRCNGDPCPNGTVCDCRRSKPTDPEADCEKIAASCEHSESPTRQVGGLTLSITW